MKPEPLKGKLHRITFVCGLLKHKNISNNTFLSTKEEIKSAVEWLKEEMRKKEKKHFTWRVENLIEQAFEDVIK